MADTPQDCVSSGIAYEETAAYLDEESTSTQVINSAQETDNAVSSVLDMKAAELDESAAAALEQQETNLTSDESALEDSAETSAVESDQNPESGQPGPQPEPVDPLAPTVTTQPQGIHLPSSQVVSGKTVTFSIKAEPSSKAPAGSTLTYQWYVDGSPIEGATNTVLCLDASLYNIGAHAIYCLVTCVLPSDGDSTKELAETLHTTNSANASLIISSGTVKNDILLFSDIHEEQSNIITLLNSYMKEHAGKLPALVVASGDYNCFDMTEEKLTKNLDAVKQALVDLHVIYLAGNHEGSTQIRILNGGTGLVYSGDILIYTINYDEIGTNGYADIADQVDAFLKNLIACGSDKPVIFLSHASLHNVGGTFLGDAKYNIDASDKLVDVLNNAGNAFPILFLFGHNHTKDNTSFYMNRGEVIDAVVSFEQKSTIQKVLNFTYGNMGYLNLNLAGKGTASVLTVGYDFLKLQRYVLSGPSGDVFNVAVPDNWRMSKPGKDDPSEDITTVSSAKTASYSKPSNTGEDMDVAMSILALLLLSGLAAIAIVVLRRKHRIASKTHE